MRGISKTFKILMWTVLTVYLFFQILAVYALIQNNVSSVQTGNSGSQYNVFPLISASLLMLIAAILFAVFRKHRYIGIIVGFIAAGVMLVVALDLGRTFPVILSGNDQDVGLSTMKLFKNHIGIAVVPILMIIAWVFERIANKNDAMARAMQQSSGYHFSDENIFVDVDENGKTTEKDEPTHRMKRSLRKRIQKE